MIPDKIIPFLEKIVSFQSLYVESRGGYIPPYLRHSPIHLRFIISDRLFWNILVGICSAKQLVTQSSIYSAVNNHVRTW